MQMTEDATVRKKPDEVEKNMVWESAKEALKATITSHLENLSDERKQQVETVFGMLDATVTIRSLQGDGDPAVQRYLDSAVGMMSLDDMDFSELNLDELDQKLEKIDYEMDELD